MRFNSVKGGNFTSAAKAVNRSADQMFAASRESAPDFTGISKAAIAARTKERNAATESKGLKDRANIGADNLIDRTKIKVKSDKDVASAKRPAKRMAGVVAGLGTLATGAVMGLNSKSDKADQAKRDAAFDERTQALRDLVDKPPAVYKTTPYVGPEAPTFESTTSTSSESTTAGAPVSDTDPTPRSVSTYKGGNLTQAQGTQLLIAQGMDPENARIGGAVMMAESGGNPGARSHPDLEARTGEMSVGLWQHNKNTGEDRHAFYGIEDWSELNTPETNARATYRLWKRRGGWGDWGAYTNGSYEKFL